MFNDAQRVSHRPKRVAFFSSSHDCDCLVVCSAKHKQYQQYQHSQPEKVIANLRVWDVFGIILNGYLAAWPRIQVYKNVSNMFIYVSCLSHSDHFGMYRLVYNHPPDIAKTYPCMDNP